jgi:DNA (cytosine-5)-methyltransferase 1
MRVRLLDLFCGAGGAGKGYSDAGFEVVGVDLDHQPNYPFDFMTGDALQVLSDPRIRFEFDAIHASPPCQRHSTLKTVLTAPYEDLIASTRWMLEMTGLPYVIENVPGARRSLINPVQICGTSLGCYDDETELRRHRLFESNWWAVGTPCRHRKHRRPVGVYGHLTFNDRPNRPVDGPTGPHGWKAGKARARKLMGIDWEVTDHDVGEAIPPAYTRWVGEQLIHILKEGT